MASNTYFSHSILNTVENLSKNLSLSQPPEVGSGMPDSKHPWKICEIELRSYGFNDHTLSSFINLYNMEGDCVILSCSLWGEKEPIKEKQEIQI